MGKIKNIRYFLANFTCLNSKKIDKRGSFKGVKLRFKLKNIDFYIEVGLDLENSACKICTANVIKLYRLNDSSMEAIETAVLFPGQNKWYATLFEIPGIVLIDFSRL